MGARRPDVELLELLLGLEGQRLSGSLTRLLSPEQSGLLVERLVLQAVLTDTVLEVVLVVMVRCDAKLTTGATANSLGSTGSIGAAVGGSGGAGPRPVFQNLLFDGHLSTPWFQDDCLWIHTQVPIGSISLFRYLSDEISPPTVLHRRGAGVYLALPGGGQASIVEGLATHFSQLRGQRARRLLRRRPPHLPLLLVAGVTAARHRQELRLLRATGRRQ
ncbi:hypothetical protein EYF80_040042 [Liparis tanakae]|uniref:Uncharacterized protein n=1 Tax=Liparis tanakae TaxID=230148 RepID=A0A4Z2G985_9TELE|nr:hypothetical protein EYF80_040042 [Liparis tanakae]